jgi:hypothetical protein
MYKARAMIGPRRACTVLEDLRMKKRLDIELTGPSPDLGGTDEGVSLRFFAAFSYRLQVAYQRAAQGVLTGVIQDDGRLPSRATEVDVRLLTAANGSLEMSVVAVDMGAHVQPMLPMSSVDTLADDALNRLMDVLAQTQHSPQSRDIPRAFRALVGGMSSDIRQRYSLMDGNRLIREVTLTSAGFDEVYESVMAGIRRVEATVRGVTFAPKSSVTLEIGGSIVKASATMAVVRAAMSLHEETFLIATLVTTSAGTRLIAIAPAVEAFPRVAPTTLETLERFADVMKILAQ